MITMKDYRIATVQVLYWMPDYRSILQEFLWQCNTEMPNMPEVHKFLNYWRDQIEAPIHRVNLAVHDPWKPTKWIRIDQGFNL